MPPPEQSPRSPRVFIGSSTEGLKIAKYIQLELDSSAECTIWSQGVFGLSGVTLESLCDTAKEFDFAVLVLTPDDLIQKRDGTAKGPRDNVIFELGLFIGVLGREATFITYCADDAIDLPSDLAGITAAKWRRRSDNNLRAALGSVCTQIQDAIEAQWRSPPPAGEPEASKPRQVAAVPQARALKPLIEALQRTGAPQQLELMEGTWREAESGSFAHARMSGGLLRFPFGYKTNGALNGEFYDWRRSGEILTAKFRWLTKGSQIFGDCYLKIESDNVLVGGWLLAEDSQRPPEFGDGMTPARWIRTKPGTTPKWVTDYYERLNAPAVT